MTLNFYPEYKKKSVLKDQPIYLHITRLEKNKLYRINTRERVKPGSWNYKTQRAKASSEGSFELNERLDGIKKRVTEIYRTSLNENPNITSQAILEKIKDYLTPPPPKPDPPKLSFFDYFDLFNKTRKPNVSTRTIKNFNVLKTHLRDFENFSETPISFEIIDLIFLERFLQYLFDEKKLANNTAYKLVIFLKTFLNWASVRKLNNNFDYKQFRSKVEDETEVIYLTENELLKLYEADLSGNKRLANIRDLFCFACFTGGRYSDVSQIKTEDIKNETWYLRTQKTKDLIEIPLNDYALEILKRHKGEKKPLPSISNQKMNDYLKELCKQLELNEPIKTVKYRGAERIETIKPKWEYIGTHTARRTFITLSLEKGMRPETLMKITGHKDFKMLKKYIKITDKVKKTEMKKIWFKEPQLKLIEN